MKKISHTCSHIFGTCRGPQAFFAPEMSMITTMIPNRTQKPLKNQHEDSKPKGNTSISIHDPETEAEDQQLLPFEGSTCVRKLVEPLVCLTRWVCRLRMFRGRKRQDAQVLRIVHHQNQMSTGRPKPTELSKMSFSVKIVWP
jgi:hypothetical protein